MELAKEIIDGLANIQSSNVLPEETFLQLLDIIMLYISKNVNNGKSKWVSLNLSQDIKVFEIQIFIIIYVSFETAIAAICPSKSDLIKTAFANISCLFIEAARHDYDEESLKHFLHNEHINGQRIETLCSKYVNNKENIQIQLELTGNNLPHVVDVDWRLHHCVKVNSLFSNNTLNLLLYIM